MANRSSTMLWLCVFFAVLIWSGISPADRFTWFLEVAPAILALIVLAATYPRFKLTPIAYVLILVHACILMVGGKYTYAEVPLFNWIRDVTHSARNSYDGVGHFAQGFIPAIVARELLIRLEVVKLPRWRFFLVLSVCLAISAAYELLEWGVAIGSGESAEAFLGTQGDPWDTQKDMGLALLGAAFAQILLAGWHDRQISASYRGFSRR